MSDVMLEVKGLTKQFGNFFAVNDLSFSVKKGEVFGFLGPNGAGKTTTMRMITNFLPATGGEVKVDGLSCIENDIKIREKIGYLPETTPLYGDMFVDEYLKYVGELRGLRSKKLKESIEKMLDVCGLQNMRKRPVAYLSKGYRQRVGLAQALIHDPELLILDEPMSGLDPNQIVEIRELIKNIGKSKTVIYCSHILSEVAATCSRILIINDGKKVALGTPEEVTAQSNEKMSYDLEIRGDASLIKEKFSEVESVDIVSLTTIKETLHTLVLDSTSSKNIGEILFKVAVDNGWSLSSLTHNKTTLEDVFTQLTKGVK
jgi:ABC-2 type transport system ATP-binding protein